MSACVHAHTHSHMYSNTLTSLKQLLCWSQRYYSHKEGGWGFLRLIKVDSLPLVVCKPALGSCMRLYPHVSAFMLPTSLISGILLSKSCVFITDKPLLTIPSGEYRQGKWEVVWFGFLLGFFLRKNSYTELESRWVLYHTRKRNITNISNLSLMRHFVDLQKPLAWSWFPFYRWGSWEREVNSLT